MSSFPLAMRRDLIETAHALADAARPIALRYFRSNAQAMENKLTSGFDPVTLADREIEHAMREILAKRRPDDAILGEEYDDVAGSTGLTWVLDPIDGTRGFVSGTPTWGVLVAVGLECGPLYGIIDQPFTQERFAGGFDEAQLRLADKTVPLGVRKCASLNDAILFSTFPEVGTNAEREGFERVRDRVKLTRYGMDCYAYGLLAAGQIDLVVEASLNAYDIQAPIAVIEAAGGIVTDWQGGPAHNGGRAVAAGDPVIHAQAMRWLNGG